MISEELRIAITGSTSHVAYALLFELGKGRVFGESQHIILQLIDSTKKKVQLDALKIELQCAAFSVVSEIIVTSDLNEGFKDADIVFLLDSQLQTQNLSCYEVAKRNALAFREQGQVLNKMAKGTVLILVVGGYANTNAWLCSQCAPDIPSSNFTTLSRLDQLGAESYLAKHLDVDINIIHNVTIWGNCSKTFFPGLRYATVESPWLWENAERSIINAVMDDVWLKTTFLQTLQTRHHDSDHVYDVSTAHAAALHMHDLWFGLSDGQWTSMGVASDGSNGVPKGMFMSFPVTLEKQKWNIVQEYGLSKNEKDMLQTSVNELTEEQKEMYDICKKFVEAGDYYTAADFPIDESDTLSTDSEETCLQYISTYEIIHPILNDLFEPFVGKLNWESMPFGAADDLAIDIVEELVDTCLENIMIQEEAEDIVESLVNPVVEDKLNGEEGHLAATSFLDSVLENVNGNESPISSRASLVNLHNSSAGNSRDTYHMKSAAKEADINIIDDLPKDNYEDLMDDSDLS